MKRVELESDKEPKGIRRAKKDNSVNTTDSNNSNTDLTDVNAVALNSTDNIIL